MANDYLVNKWHQWFQVIDINQKGEISRSDVKDEGDTFSRLSHISDPKKQKEMQETLDRIWNGVVFRNRSGAINEEQFVEMNKKLYAADKVKLVQEMTAALTTLFSEVIDLFHEGAVTEEEYINIMRACGHKKIPGLKQFFALYNPVDGKVPINVIVDSWIQFTTSDDSSKKDLVVDGIKSGFV